MKVSAPALTRVSGDTGLLRVKPESCGGAVSTTKVRFGSVGGTGPFALSAKSRAPVTSTAKVPSSPARMPLGYE